MSIAIYTLTSSLHDEKAIRAISDEFLGSIKGGFEFDVRGADFQDYGTHDLDLIYVRSGGTENLFKQVLPTIKEKGGRMPILLLTSGKSNSLAASLEILSFLRQEGMRGEVLHGESSRIKKRIAELQATAAAVHKLEGARYGVIGKPSDWLISSEADYAAVKEKLGIELLDIPMEELMSAIAEASDFYAPTLELADASPAVQASYPGAVKIYFGLKKLVAKYNLKGLTLRCFDLLTSVRNTGCLALARLNSEGIIAGCEGDVPAMISMAVADSVTGVSGFQANPASINADTGEFIFAHCTIPLNMVTRYALDTHFESGIGVGIRGHMQEGPVTLFKISGDCGRYFAAEGSLVRNQAKPDLCRTQLVLDFDKSVAQYFLNDPISNHHIIIPGHVKSRLEALLG